MPRVNRARLLALSHREFNREASAPSSPPPASKKFRGIRLSLSRYDAGWDKKRGAAARMMAVVLLESDQDLTKRVCADARSAATYRGAAEWLEGEAKVLRKQIRHLELAAERLAIALQRCDSTSLSPPQ